MTTGYSYRMKGHNTQTSVKKYDTAINSVVWWFITLFITVCKLPVTLQYEHLNPPRKWHRWCSSHSRGVRHHSRHREHRPTGASFSPTRLCLSWWASRERAVLNVLGQTPHPCGLELLFFPRHFFLQWHSISAHSVAARPQRGHRNPRSPSWHFKWTSSSPWLGNAAWQKTQDSPSSSSARFCISDVLIKTRLSSRTGSETPAGRFGGGHLKLEIRHRPRVIKCADWAVSSSSERVRLDESGLWSPSRAFSRWKTLSSSLGLSSNKVLTFTQTTMNK